MDKDFILNHFTQTKIGIFTSNEHKAEKIFNEIYTENKNNIKHFRNSNQYKELMLNDETYYVWIKPSQGARGHKCRKAYIDQDIDIQIFQEIIVPICMYCSKSDIKII